MESRLTFSRLVAGRALAAIFCLGGMAACNHGNPTPTTAASHRSGMSTDTTAGMNGGAAKDNLARADMETAGRSDSALASDHSDPNAPGMNRDEHRFWREAKMASHREIAYSELAVTQASDPRIRTFAQQVLDDHRRMAEDARGMKGVAADDTAWSKSDWIKQDRGYERLSAKTGTDFDRAYLDMIIDERRDAVAMYEKAAKDREAADRVVQGFAGNHLAVMRQHLEQAKTLRKNLG
ncbi:MAG: hypothetical protein JWM32_2629 [Verrucomicrobia bacterium]|nr:hypothetical protein [Verrucomicrobiota bacterium]